jgi:nitrite reductase/ring-hydroxylating ferredoxin subunit/uncharacterized membrane protein
VLANFVDGIERSEAFDGVVEGLRNVGQRYLSSKKVRSALSGTPIGHPAHPVLVDLPIGLWTSAMALDFTGTHHRKAARRLVGLGVVAALPAVATGLSDWLDTDGAEARVGLVHASANAAAFSAYAISWRARRKGHMAGLGWSLVGATLLTVGGWLGGHLAYGLGIGVDTNAFEAGPEEWSEAEGGVPSDDQPICVVAGGIRIAAVTTESGVAALADRCSHRGGPLSEGKRSGNCLVCPWHGSVFDIHSGLAMQGPASERQPTYETRLVDNVLEVRRKEPRALRKRPVRPTS